MERSGNPEPEADCDNQPQSVMAAFGPAFKVKPKPLDLPPGLSYDKVAELLETLEGPLHR